ncbi:hypothetical protein [Kineosporia babensis]|uniref:Uncharacterized protein n=1 Tax=Kineosporia babensis TaxID=499548 RepID=A0A9X1N6Q2_9ACTN|nr:hypothetical protein [Kineosporia babensis]MCD5309352.1 hypothetical protein [Kineosporia babensis]
MAGSPLDAALSAGSSIGRYFSVAALIPATLLVVYLTGLLTAGALCGPFQASTGLAALGSLGLSGLGWVVSASIATGVCLLPLTFRFTQLLEGYWGHGTLAIRVTEHFTRVHRCWLFGLNTWRGDREKAWTKPDPVERTQLIAIDGVRGAGERRLNKRRGDRYLQPYLEDAAATAAIAGYPTSARRVLPTRLGNALRRMEDSSGRPYGLDAITVAPHLAMVCEERQQAQVSDAREMLDLSVNLCAVGALACLATLVLLADDGFWILLALAPLAFSWLAYLGAIEAAGQFATCFSAMLALSRLKLYDTLCLKRPTSIITEAENHGPKITKLLDGQIVPLSLTQQKSTSDDQPAGR